LVCHFLLVRDGCRAWGRCICCGRARVFSNQRQSPTRPIVRPPPGQTYPPSPSCRLKDTRPAGQTPCNHHVCWFTEKRSQCRRQVVAPSSSFSREFEIAQNPRPITTRRLEHQGNFPDSSARITFHPQDKHSHRNKRVTCHCYRLARAYSCYAMPIVQLAPRWSYSENIGDAMVDTTGLEQSDFSLENVTCGSFVAVHV
jgi:hypothetical protein